MTTIVGVEGIDYAVLVADSQITEDNLVTLATSTPKIIEVGKFLIGISGDTRPGDILAYNWKPPLYRGEDPAQFMGRKIIPSILTAFNDNSRTGARSPPPDLVRCHRPAPCCARPASRQRGRQGIAGRSYLRR